MSRSSQPAASLAAPQSTEPEPLLFSSSSSSTSSSSPTPIMDALSRILDARPSADTMSIVATTVIVTLATFYFCRYVLYPKWRRIIPSPLRASLPKEASHAIHDHIYNPDTLPGGRDVTTPYGTVRVYEFGDLEGPKVLLVHGISTPCITLAPLARARAARGCRVMVFDLFGRGFTDGVGDLPHDERLYTTNILLALASPPLPWTGQHGFRLVGYSLGGALAASFAASFPHMVESLILLAPAGLISAADFGTVARLTFRSGLVPRRLLAFATKRRLQRPIAASTNRKPTLRQQPSATGKILDVAASETTHPSIPPPEMPLERRVDDYVRWMVTHHAGFVPAFMSCIRHAPLTDQHPTWAQLGRVMGKGRTAVLLAQGDEIIDCVDYERQGLPLLGGPDAVHWRVLGGTHDFVMTHTGDIAAELDHFWGMKAPEAEA